MLKCCALTQQFFSLSLTGIDKKLIGKTGMINVVDSGSKNGGHDFQIGKHRLKHTRWNMTNVIVGAYERQKRRVNEYFD